MGKAVYPELIDAATRERLIERFGPRVIGWYEELPARVDDLARRWKFRITEPISRGRNSCVLLCERDSGEMAVLKLTPERNLAVAEASALAAWWGSGRVPRVFEFDDESGVILMEAIQPGAVLQDEPSRIQLDEIVGLVRNLHASASEEAVAGFPPLVERVEFIFAFSGGLLEKPGVASSVSFDLVEESLARARQLAVRPGRRVLLHGDLHPGNVLDGGEDRGYVAVDPCACVGGPAFDLVDWVFVGGGDMAALARRAEWLAGEAGVDPDRLLRWCGCTAVLVAIAWLSREENPEKVRSLLELAAAQY